MMSSVKNKTVEVVVFQNPQKRNKQESVLGRPIANKKKEDKSDAVLAKSKVFNQKQAKYDIRKLAIHGMDKQNKDKAKVDLLIELGAKPPKNRCYHIQEYQMLKKKQEEENKKSGLEIKTAMKKSKSDRRKRHKDDLFKTIDGQAGFFKEGVQFVNKLKK
ncbi:hypothetical protein BgiMline_020097 [Biomphalaria glabrata]|uniref:Uncharacterized protein LOC106056741 n=1 Tax=Biomphalaria glabrata TaxID=6526 RepID=A0A9U8E1E6_BIOGL|nr:uncharacterized protein LOC106056741 [Biomphalaria glabrata]XP_013069034.2 uncharacterized protein LOC106056741 [Biomphalaria glabrata]KAI8732319.1 hypothetical protein BgiMline_029800 [Biomphalaria glabrata]